MHVEIGEWKRDVSVDFRRKVQLVSEPLQMETEDFRKMVDTGVLDTVTKFLTTSTTVHVVAFQLVVREERTETILQSDIRSDEPTLQPVPRVGEPTDVVVGGGGARQHGLRVHVAEVFFRRYGNGDVLERLEGVGDTVASETLHRTQQLPVKYCRYDAPVTRCFIR